VRIVEAVASDSPNLAEFFLDNPLSGGSDFVLDRSPDFQALLRLRGHARTFCAREGGRLVGIVTALWDDRRGSDGTVLRVGEVVDLRVASSARGGRAARELLAAVLRAFAEAGVEWLTAVVADENRAAVGLVEGKAGLPRLVPLTRYVSVHFIALHMPLRPARQVAVREAGDADSAIVTDAVCRCLRPFRLAPTTHFVWPDHTGRHRAWIAAGDDGEPNGVLLVWDGFDVRRVRVVRYSGSDRLLRSLTLALAQLGLVAPLPPPGGAVRMWASRALWNRDGSAGVTRALVSASLRAAADAGVHVVQVNLRQTDPLLGQLPRYPRSTFYSTLFGAPREGTAATPEVSAASAFYADLAMV
jgi:ribosomal protein S18 acetylase RimI-like enzyme